MNIFLSNIMQITEIEISKLIPYEKNAKEHTKDQIEKVAKSIKEFGWQQPIVVDKNNVIVIGHCRYEAAKLLKFQSAPCLMAENLSEEQIKTLRLADNKLNESKWSKELVLEEFGTLDTYLQSLTGFEIEDLGINMSNSQGVEIKKILQVVIECSDETHQQEVYEQLLELGLNPKIINV